MNRVASDFHVYHELMQAKIREILLVSSPYDAFIMEEEGSLAARIIDEYQGLNLSHPPRLQRVNSAGEALEIVGKRKIDLVITMPNVDDMDAGHLGQEIKKIVPGLPVVLLAHSLRSVSDDPDTPCCVGIDKFFIWSSDPALLLSIVKNVEDHLNVAHDTEHAGVRVLILVEDSPQYLSYMLPLIYSEVVRQTQSVLADSLNNDHRLLKMRARPKILIAQNFEDALQLYHTYKPYVFGVIADGRFPKEGQVNEKAGLTFLQKIRADMADLALLLMSAETSNRDGALAIPAVFLDKNSPKLSYEIHDFFLNQLGFGDFVFRMADGSIAGWADNLRSFEEKIATIPEESLLYHACRNHFSNWILARSEVALATELLALQCSDFSSPGEMRMFLVDRLHKLRRSRQRGIIASFDGEKFDAEIMDFVKIGKGSLGGKARGLAFMANQIATAAMESDKSMTIHFPKTLVISSDGFTAFVDENKLTKTDNGDTDEQIAARFLAADMPSWLFDHLKIYLTQMTGPISVRSSSLLEDAQFKPYAGLYSTYMLPNNHKDFNLRLGQFINAVKLIYASTWFAGPQAFSKRTRTGQSGDDQMAVIVQQVVGSQQGDCFYPGVSGVAQSYNFYPVSYMKAEEGIASIAMGFGKTVVEGEKSLRFSPKYPKVLPQFSSVDDILANAQRFFYALKMIDYPEELAFDPLGNLIRREVNEAAGEMPVQMLAGSYLADEHRVRDGDHGGVKILTFARILKYNQIPLARAISEVLEIGRRGMGCPVEIEFALDLAADPEKSKFYFLQMRPMVAGSTGLAIEISSDDYDSAFCVSSQALGHGVFSDISDVIYVRPDMFDPAKTREIAKEVGTLNSILGKEKRPYLLVGPGRWGSADPWLGIPVQWQDISGVGAIVELRNDKIRADPSQGSHFFHNITSMGIPYVTVTEGEDRLDWSWFAGKSIVHETDYLHHVHCKNSFTIKINSKESQCVMLG